MLSKCSGGGCFIALSSSLVSSPIILTDNDVKLLFVKASTHSFKFIVGAAYMSQDCSLDQFIKHTETVESLMARFNTFKLMMFGDYNIARVTWSVNCDLSYNIVNSANHNITDKAICLYNSFGSNARVAAWTAGNFLQLV